MCKAVSRVPSIDTTPVVLPGGGTGAQTDNLEEGSPLREEVGEGSGSDPELLPEEGGVPQESSTDRQSPAGGETPGVAGSTCPEGFAEGLGESGEKDEGNELGERGGSVNLGGPRETEVILCPIDDYLEEGLSRLAADTGGRAAQALCRSFGLNPIHPDGGPASYSVDDLKHFAGLLLALRSNPNEPMPTDARHRASFYMFCSLPAWACEAPGSSKSKDLFSSWWTPSPAEVCAMHPDVIKALPVPGLRAFLGVIGARVVMADAKPTLLRKLWVARRAFLLQTLRECDVSQPLPLHFPPTASTLGVRPQAPSDNGDGGRQAVPGVAKRRAVDKPGEEEDSWSNQSGDWGDRDSDSDEQCDTRGAAWVREPSEESGSDNDEFAGWTPERMLMRFPPSMRDQYKGLSAGELRTLLDDEPDTPPEDEYTATDGAKTVVYTATALDKWEISGLRGLLAHLWSSPEVEVPAMPKAQVIQQIVASHMYSFRFLLGFSLRVAGRNGVDPQCIARWDSLHPAGAGRIVVAVLGPGRTHPARATYAIEGQQGGDAGWAAVRLTGAPARFPTTGWIQGSDRVIVVAHGAGGGSGTSHTPPRPAAVWTDYASGGGAVAHTQPTAAVVSRGSAFSIHDQAAIDTLVQKEIKASRRKDDGTRCLLDVVGDPAVLQIVSANHVAAGAAACLSVLRARVMHMGLYCQCPLNVFMGLGLSLANVELRHFVPLMAEMTYNEADAAASQFVGHRSESPCKTEVVDYVNNDPERGRATLECVFTLWSDLFDAVPAVREELLAVALRVKMVAARLAHWSVDNLLFIMRSALTQVDKLLSRVGQRFAVRLQDCAFGFVPQAPISSWTELVVLLRSIPDFDSDPYYKDKMMNIRLRCSSLEQAKLHSRQIVA